MKRTSENTIEITDEEARMITYFIQHSLERAWDRHTDNYICTCSWTEGVRSMDPEMYDFGSQLEQI